MSKNQATGSGPAGRSSKVSKDGAEDMETLANALRLEREKNDLLLNEVVALEDALVNRELEEFADAVSEDTRDFWREQLLSNRDAATMALKELQTARTQSGGTQNTRRPLHNRSTSRPVHRRGLVGEGGATEGPSADSVAVKIRNRAQELCKSERIPFSTAFRQAEREFCEEAGR